MSKPWADGPFELIAIPGTPGTQTSPNADLQHIVATMANVHTAFIRGLNAIYLQAPHISSPTDIHDFTVFIRAWFDSVHHHHQAEESGLFPQFEGFAVEAGLPAGAMSANVDQHREFDAKMEEAAAWVERAEKGEEKYDGAVLKGLIDGFAPVLIKHLHEEIDTLLKLEKCDGKKLMHAMEEMEKETVKTADPNIVIPFMLGCIDQSFPGSEKFPPVPWFIPYMNALWFGRTHKGAWRFCPCDQWCRKRELQFL